MVVYPHLIPDRQKNMWLVKNSGLKLLGSSFSSTAKNLILDARIIDDDIWIVTEGGGLQQFSTISKKITTYKFTQGTNSISSNDLVCMLVDEKRNVWIGTKGSGLNYFNRQLNKFYQYTTRDGLGNNSIFSLVMDQKNRLWMGTANGLSCFDLTVRQSHTFRCPSAQHPDWFSQYHVPGCYNCQMHLHRYILLHH